MSEQQQSSDQHLAGAGYMAVVANYDAAKDYFYRNFWRGRQYEHLAEVSALYTIFTKFVKVSEGTLLDLGGAFGRLIPVTQEFFDNIVLGDYSIKELKDFENNRINISPRVSVYRVGVNAYALPFKEGVFDAVLSVRVMHHINTPRGMFDEVYRVLKPGGIFVLEFAHKNHIKAIVRALLHRDWEFFRKDIIKQKHNPKTAQGVVDASKIIFNNYSFGFIINHLRGAGFKIAYTQPVSFLRIPILKRIFGYKPLLFVERILQRFRFLRITPSIFVVAQKPAEESYEEKQREPSSSQSNEGDKLSFNLYDLLVCPNPKHRKPLDIQKDLLSCPDGETYKLIDGKIPDLRYPPND